MAENLLFSANINNVATIDIPSGHKSTNDILLAFTLPDHNEFDSTFYKQRCTLRSSL